MGIIDKSDSIGSLIGQDPDRKIQNLLNCVLLLYTNIFLFSNLIKIKEISIFY